MGRGPTAIRNQLIIDSDSLYDYPTLRNVHLVAGSQSVGLACRVLGTKRYTSVRRQLIVVFSDSSVFAYRAAIMPLSEP